MASFLARALGLHQLDLSLPPQHGSHSLTSGFIPDPYTVPVTGGGRIDVSYLGGPCRGHTSRPPDFRLNYTKGAHPLLRFYYKGSGDAVMVINDPVGNYYCNDDSFSTSKPTLDFSSPKSGRYDIWIGTYGPGSLAIGTLFVTENSGNHP
jgi:hypothetical protein